MKYIFPILLLCCFQSLHAQINLTWEKEIGGGEDDWGYGLCLSADGQYVFTAVTSSYDEEVTDSIGGTDIWLGKMDTDSAMVWSHSYGGTLNDRGNDVCLSADDGFVITGFTESNDVDITSNNGSKDLFVIKTDANGELEWSKAFGGTSDEIGNSVLALSNGNTIVVGSAFSSDGDINNNAGFSDFWILHLDTNGNLLWEKTYGGSSEDRAKKIIQTQDGNFAILGTSFSSDGDISNNLGGVDFWLIKIDQNGDLLWEKSFGGSSADQGSDLIEISSGELIITGEVLSNNGDVIGNHGFTDAWVAKLDSNGNLLWQNSLGGTMVDYFLAITEADDGGFIATGNTFSDNGDVSNNLGESDIWIVKLSNNGILEWEKTIGYDLNEIGNAILSVGEEIIILGGIQVDHLRHGNSDAYIAKLRAPFTSVTNIKDYPSLIVYPNPSKDFIWISHETPILSYQLFNIIGQKIQQGNIQSTEIKINVQHLPKGEYVLLVSMNEGQEVSIPILITE
jgi:hypothetical protein